MRITVHALVDGNDGRASQNVTIGVIERAADTAPGSGPGLLLGESRDVSKNLQSVVLQKQAALLAIAVGMPVAQHPPHRSVRAQLRHTAPTLGV
jgi:hypothetical protein